MRNLKVRHAGVEGGVVVVKVHFDRHRILDWRVGIEVAFGRGQRKREEQEASTVLAESLWNGERGEQDHIVNWYASIRDNERGQM